jgi:hypothetical protein
MGRIVGLGSASVGESEMGRDGLGRRGLGSQTWEGRERTGVGWIVRTDLA